MTQETEPSIVPNDDLKDAVKILGLGRRAVDILGKDHVADVVAKRRAAYEQRQSELPQLTYDQVIMRVFYGVDCTE